MIPDLFSIAEGDRLKREGMERAADARQGPLKQARRMARFLAQQGRLLVTIDDVIEYGFPELTAAELGNAAGSVFKEKCWRLTAQRVKSRRASNHAREIKVWEYVG